MDSSLIAHEKKVNQILNPVLTVLYLLFGFLILTVVENITVAAVLFILAVVVGLTRLINDRESMVYSKYIYTLTFVLAGIFAFVALGEDNQGAPFQAFMGLVLVAQYFDKKLILLYTILTLTGHAIALPLFPETYSFNYNLQTGIFVVVIFLTSALMGLILCNNSAGLIKKAEEGERSSRKLAERIKEVLGLVKTAGEELMDTAGKLAQSTGKMSQGAEQQAVSTRDLNASMEEMSQAIQEVSQDTGETSSYSEKVTGELEKISGQLKKVARDLNQTDSRSGEVWQLTRVMKEAMLSLTKEVEAAEKHMQNTLDRTREGRQKAENSAGEMKKINRSVSDLTEVVRQLGSSAGRIGEIIEVIEDIAEQTNLLALNASIEAARAGEQGRGFAVVAGAVGDLAGKAREAAGDIADLIKSIQGEIQQAVITAEDGSSRVEKGGKLVQAAGEAFSGIQQDVRSFAEKMQKMAEMVYEQEQKSYEINLAAGEIKTLIDSLREEGEQQAVSTEEMVKIMEKMRELAVHVTSAAQQQAASIQEVTATTENLSEIATDNATNSETISHSSQRLEELSFQLKQLVEEG